VTLRTWLQLWPSCVVLVMLLTRLDFPARPLRNWLASGVYVAAASDEGPWFVTGGPYRTPNELGPFDSHRKAVAYVTYPMRVRSFLSDLIICPWCLGGWATLASVLIFATGSMWDRLCWWGPLWASVSIACVTVNRIMEG
jgi:hypothetical protein